MMKTAIKFDLESTGRPSVVATSRDGVVKEFGRETLCRCGAVVRSGWRGRPRKYCDVCREAVIFEDAKRRRDRDPEAWYRASRDWMRTHPEACREARRRYYLGHRSERLAAVDRWQRANPEKVAAKSLRSYHRRKLKAGA